MTTIEAWLVEVHPTPRTGFEIRCASEAEARQKFDDAELGPTGCVWITHNGKRVDYREGQK
jgi:hypothetical protein